MAVNIFGPEFKARFDERSFRNSPIIYSLSYSNVMATATGYSKSIYSVVFLIIKGLTSPSFDKLISRKSFILRSYVNGLPQCQTFMFKKTVQFIKYHLNSIFSEIDKQAGHLFLSSWHYVAFRSLRQVPT